MKKALIVVAVVLGLYFLFAGTSVSSKAVIIDNSYGYPIAFHVPDKGMVGHNDPLFAELAIHWNSNAKEYNPAVIESGYDQETMKNIEKLFLKK